MADDDFADLRRALYGEEGSFLLALRIALEWDREAFSRLVVAMERYARAREGHPTLERWAAEGFWYLEGFVPEWSSHPSFPRPHGEDYYQAAYRRLHDLAYWLFLGESPYQGSGPLGPI